MWADEIEFLNRAELEKTVSQNGTVSLKWSLPGDRNGTDQYRLEQSPDATFSAPSLRYEGADRGSVISGLPEGHHFFRIGKASGEGEITWSPTLRISVEFLARQRLFIFLGLGGFVVLSTICTIVVCHFRSRNRLEKGEELLPA